MRKPTLDGRTELILTPLELLEDAKDKMGLRSTETPEGGSTPNAEEGPSGLRRAAARCWALLLVRIYECLLLMCPHCGQAPAVVPARAPPQADMEFNQGTELVEWAEMDQTAGTTDDIWD